MGREIRNVPSKWKHPQSIRRSLKGEEISYRPMYQRDFKEAYSEWQKDLAEWYESNSLWHDKGLHKGYGGEVQTVEECVKSALERWEKDNVTQYHSKELALINIQGASYEWYAGEPPSPPNPNDYMPFGSWYQLYETVSEGTPLSPPFKTKKQLVEWLSQNEDFWGHRWTPEQATAMVKQEYAPSMVVSSGKIYTAEESLLL